MNFFGWHSKFTKLITIYTMLKSKNCHFFCLKVDAPTLQLYLPLLISGYGGLNSLSLELYNKLYLDNKLSYYIRVAVWQQIFLKIRCNVVVFNQSMLFLYKVKKPQFLLVKPRLSLAGPKGLEPSTSGLTGKRPIFYTPVTTNI